MSRWRLHVTKLEEFAEFCERSGWVRTSTKGDYEVLRMTRNGSPPLIVHTRIANYRGNAVAHYTLHGVGEKMFDQYQNSLCSKVKP